VNESRSRGEILAAFSLLALAVIGVLLAGGRGPGRAGAASSFISLPTSVAAAEPDPWKLAVRQVTEDRGAAMGRQAQVEVPGQLRHYSDTRRFLAIQVAEWREHQVSTPRDFAGLAEMIRARELVEVAPVADSYVLYGVGGLADTGSFTYYDKQARRSVKLLDDAELGQEYARLNEAATILRAENDALTQELAALGKGERTRRASLRAQIVKKEAALKAMQEQAALLDSYYGAAERRHALADERAALAALAGDFSGRAYDLADAAARKEMKVRMLSHLRPEALAILQELADSYHAQFKRPLPVTSLVRPDEYQHRLGESNANATRIATPPHSTGLAFDILYRYMTAEEQAYVMADIARLRDAGRVEALRENRDHFHVFAFIDGQRPDEDLIRASLDHSAAPREKAAAETPKKGRKAELKKSDRKETAKRARKPSGRSGASARQRGR
jgi:DNA-binding transcriptional ArsR family regulator